MSTSMSTAGRSPEVRALIDDIRAQGYDLEVRGESAQLMKNGQIVRTEAGVPVKIHLTPSDWRGPKNDRTRLRKAGVLPPKERGAIIADAITAKRAKREARTDRHLAIVYLLQEGVKTYGSQSALARVVAKIGEAYNIPEMAVDPVSVGKRINRYVTHPDDVMGEMQLRAFEQVMRTLGTFRNYDDAMKQLDYKLTRKREFEAARIENERRRLTPPEREAARENDPPEIKEAIEQKEERKEANMTQAFWLTLFELRGFAGALPPEQRVWLSDHTQSLMHFAKALGIAPLTTVKEDDNA